MHYVSSLFQWLYTYCICNKQPSKLKFIPQWNYYDLPLFVSLSLLFSYETTWICDEQLIIIVVSSHYFFSVAIHRFFHRDLIDWVVLPIIIALLINILIFTLLLRSHYTCTNNKPSENKKVDKNLERLNRKKQLAIFVLSSFLKLLRTSFTSSNA